MNISYLTFDESKLFDRYLIDHCFLSIDQLIERAGYLIYRWVDQFFSDMSVIAYVGKGNNGKDALVSCRYLAAKGVSIYLLFLDKGSVNEKEAKQLLLLDNVLMIDSVADIPSFKGIVIDALFGVGIRPLLDESIVSLISDMHDLNCPIISIDVPSGITELSDTVVVHSTYTLSMMFPNVFFWIQQSENTVEKFII